MNPIQIIIGTDNFNRPEALFNEHRSERRCGERDEFTGGYYNIFSGETQTAREFIDDLSAICADENDSNDSNNRVNGSLVSRGNNTSGVFRIQSVTLNGITYEFDKPIVIANNVTFKHGYSLVKDFDLDDFLSGGGGWFGPYTDALTALSIVISQLKPAFDAAASLAKHNPSSKVPVFLRNFNAPDNKLLFMGRVKGTTAMRVSSTLKTVAPGLTALSVVNTGYDIINDGSLTFGDAFQAINTSLQLTFPVYGVLYGVVDIGVSMYTGGTSLTSLIKTGIDSNINASYDF